MLYGQGPVGCLNALIGVALLVDCPWNGWLREPSHKWGVEWGFRPVQHGTGNHAGCGHRHASVLVC